MGDTFIVGSRTDRNRKTAREERGIPEEEALQPVSHALLAAEPTGVRFSAR